MDIIVGLGNPGKQYIDTKHNVGFQVIDFLAKQYQISVTKLKHKAFIGEGSIEGKKVMLVKPQTYMNLSGESVREILSFYKLPINNLLIIYDDTSLPLNNIRIRAKGSAGGHNGIKSIISQIGTDSFRRVKVGIGEKPNGWDLADYVLSHFTKDEQPLIESSIEKAAQAVVIMVTQSTEQAMNKMNQKMR